MPARSRLVLAQLAFAAHSLIRDPSSALADLGGRSPLPRPFFIAIRGNSATLSARFFLFTRAFAALLLACVWAKMADWSVGAYVPKPHRKGPTSPLVKSSGSGSDAAVAPPAPAAASVAIPASAAAVPQPFVFERPKIGSRSSLLPEETVPQAAPNAVTLHLPQKAWAALSSSLTTRELGRLVQVCRAWRASVASYVRVVTLWSDGAKIKQLRAIAPNVERIVFADAATLMNCGEADLPSLANLTDLRVLAPPQAFPARGGVHDASMVEFCLISPHLPLTLTSLSVPMARFSRGSLVPLEKLSSLTHLDLSRGDWRADDWNWTPLSDNPAIDDWIDRFPTSLVSLNLAHCHVLSDRVMKKFKRLPKLRVLNVENCFQLTDVGMSSLPPTVELLDMAQCIGVFRKGDARLGVLPPRLSWLRLSFNFNDHFVGYIPNTLTALLLEKSFVTDAGMKVILSQLRNLAELSCAACINVGDATLALLPATLRTLDLWHNRNVTDEGIKLLMSRAAVEVLDVTACAKLSLSGLLAAARPSLRTLAVGSLFVPDGLIPKVAIIRSKVGIHSLRPKLFSEMQYIGGATSAQGHTRGTGVVSTSAAASAAVAAAATAVAAASAGGSSGAKE